MKKAIGWLSTPLLAVLFFSLLIVFHVAQVLALRIGYTAHKRVVDCLNFCLLASLKVVGARIKIICDHELPANTPLIVIANHQSMYDIPLLGWTFRRHHPKYVAKTELSKGLPSISYNLRHGGSVLIDRNDPRGAMRAIQKFGRQVEEHCYTACIFPEGTRARDGVMKDFNPAGVMTLVRAAPSAIIVPVAIDGSWELMRYRIRPIPFGVRIRCTVLEAIDPSAYPLKELAAVAEKRIKESLAAGSRSL